MSDRMNSIIQDIEKSAKKVDILPVDEDVLNNIINTYQINKESLLGTIIHNTGGIVIDNWIRIYGAGKANFYQRNIEFPYKYDNFFLVAEDILGGLFAVTDNGSLAYFAPDALEWEENLPSYSQFLYWCIHGDTDQYYCDYRWNTWKEDTSNLPLDKGIAFYPFLWAQAELEARNRREIPMTEIIQLELDFEAQLREQGE